MAVGFACGLVLGLIPKGNLLAVFVATLLFSTKMNIAMGMFSAVVFSFAAPFGDPLTHRIGEAVLTHPTLMPLWRRLYQLPFAAWTGFNNTVVMGSFLLGILLFYPAYRLALPWTTRLRRSDLAAAAGVSAAVSSVEHRDGLATECLPLTASGASGAAICPTIPRRVVPEQRRQLA